ncbi:MAG: endonuclease, partial [Acidobacteriota bacterium]
WWSGFQVDVTDQDNSRASYGYFLVSGFTGTVGDDLDAADDGVLDQVPWTAILDSVAVDGGVAGDHFYGAEIVLPAFFDGASFSPGGASRLPNGVDTDTAADWVRNDWQGTGRPGLAGNLEPNEAVNTPGTLNTRALPAANPAILNEIVFDHAGGVDDSEFLEIFGDAGADYSSSWLVVLDGGGEVVALYGVGSTDPQGLWTTGYVTEELPDGTLTVLLVRDFTGAMGDDLDAADDGSLDLEPWSQIDDAVAFDPGSGGGATYSGVVLTASALGGASRIPHGVDTDAAADWQPNDFDGAGLPGSAALPGAGEAWNTHAAVNRTNGVDYYAGVDASTPAALRGSLHALIDDHQRFPYTASTTDTWDVLEEADQDPGDPGRVLTLYRNSSAAKAGGGNSVYNREHTWPSSYGFPDRDDSYPYTDCHSLRLADIGYNSDRGSRPFGTCSASCSERTTEVNAGHGGGSGVYPGNSNWLSGPDQNSGIWEAWGHRRGDVARSLLYLDVRYEGGNHGLTGLAEPDLVLTDDTSLIVRPGFNTTGTAYLGRLATLLAWHAADPPDDGERRRNEVVYRHQGNRNPFVDHPEWVACVFAEGAGEGCGVPPIFLDDFESGTTSAWSSTQP